MKRETKSWLVSCSLVIVVLGSLGYIGVHKFLDQIFTRPTVTLELISRWTALEFPSGAKLEASWIGGAINEPEMLGKVRIPEDSLQSFIKNTKSIDGIAKTSDIDMQDRIREPRIPVWWKPNLLKSRVSFCGQPDSACSFWTTVGTGGPGYTVVYVHYMMS
jgi:hypothetical protein